MPVISDHEREQRSRRMRGQLADPEFVAKMKAGQDASWTPERRASQRAILAKRRNDPKFQKKRRHDLQVPEHSHPTVQGLFVEIKRQRAFICEVVERAGLGDGTLCGWRFGMPKVDLLDAALNTLDLELAIVPIGSRDENGFARTRKQP